MALTEAFANAPANKRPRLVRALGRIARTFPTALEFLRQSLSLEHDERVLRAIANALGRTGNRELEDDLLRCLARTEMGSLARQAIVEALSKVGGEKSQRALADLVPKEADQKARLRLARTTHRVEEARIDLSRALPEEALIVARSRSGLEPMVRDELDAFHPRIVTDRNVGPRVELRTKRPLETLWISRAMSHFGFAFESSGSVSETDLPKTIANALCSAQATALLGAVAIGRTRYRIEWARGGKRRSLTYAVAHAVDERNPYLRNDPTKSHWEAVIHERSDGVRVELIPKVIDPRFSYRDDAVPAASHPTIAAALARAAGSEPNDVVWDPFLGSGLELCERSLSGPYRRLLGTDIDPKALKAARSNLLNVGATRVELLLRDAFDFPTFSERPNVILTNPPMGRRVLRERDLVTKLTGFVELVAESLPARGRFVWLSPFPQKTRLAAIRSGLALSYSAQVDMGGFLVELQRFDKAPSRR